MKRFLTAAMILIATMFVANLAMAQVRVNVNINSQPAWAPQGYDNAQYYYIPDMDLYYDVSYHQFVYPSGGSWKRSATLPAAYRKYDLYTVHKVPLNEANAYRFHDRDKKQYGQFVGKHDQNPIRDSHEEKYAGNKDNWRNNQFRNNASSHNRNRNDGRPNRRQ